MGFAHQFYIIHYYLSYLHYYFLPAFIGGYEDRGIKPDISSRAKKETIMAKEITMQSLLAAGAHFGHKTSKWNPKMSKYIYTSRNGVHIMHLEKTVAKLNEAAKALEEAAKEGKTILFVGTKNQAKDIIRKAAKEVGMPFVAEKWLGGTLTNYPVISKLTKKLKELEGKKASDEWEFFTKKEKLVMEREMKKLETNVGGIREMTKLPDMVFVIDVKNEQTAVREVRHLNIPIVAIVDSNSDPVGIAHVIPANDDSTKGLQLIVEFLTEAIKRGTTAAAAPVSQEKPAEAPKTVTA